MHVAKHDLALDDRGHLAEKYALKLAKYGIYAFLVDDDVIRFGESGRGYDRIRDGFNLETEKAPRKWLRYMFRTEYAGGGVQLRYYSDEESDLLSTPVGRRGVEAELAYQYRRNSPKNRYPKHMTEVHFYNDLPPQALALVRAILKDLGLRYY